MLLWALLRTKGGAETPNIVLASTLLVDGAEFYVRQLKVRVPEYVEPRDGY
jgi:hypothetical protein